MTETMVSSATREVLLGPDHPFVIIGERINPTGRKLLADEMTAGDYSRVERDALSQVAAGALMLDVNAGLPMADEAKVLAEAVQRVQAIVDVPLSIDSSGVEPIANALEVYKGKALVNSVNGESKRMEAIFPLVKKHNAAVIALCNDDSGISHDPDERFEVAKNIVEHAADYGIPKSDILMDPLVMTVGAINTAGSAVIKLLRRLQEELEVNTTGGMSNISFGLPNRDVINSNFLAMAISAGLNSAITNPLHASVVSAVKAADLMMGRDPNCTNWIKTARQAAKAAKEAEEAEAAKG